ncbi:glycosyltransferase [Roseovarius aestuariivivens]|uniref:glycosyltransferase n=1 Tax=Roseovarius aestuariivivens TaxID=1888910 RepID=UPI001081E3C1|nr:glycosyltransferase [Roseovarius aestuariivivens]
MRAIGICRFSYPALGGFKRMHDTVEEREAYLYDDARMALRFRHFETLTLPSLAAQQDGRFAFLVITGENMPEPWWSRLNDVCASVPQIKVITKPPMRHRTAMQLAIKEELGEDDVPSLQFRLDDDDAVGTQFVRGIRRTARLSYRMWATWQNFVIEYSSGYAVRLGAEGILAQPVQGQFLACGLAVLFKPGDPKTVMNYGHHKLHHAMPTLIVPDEPMYLRAVHEDNDSRAAHSKLAPLDDGLRADFQNRFNVSEASVKEAFCAPAVPPGKG